jgi:hypothetical protein
MYSPNIYLLLFFYCRILIYGCSRYSFSLFICFSFEKLQKDRRKNAYIQ